MVMGHAHPKIVEAVRERVALGTHFAQPTEDALIVADQLAERFQLPYWRFGNSGTESTLDAVRIMRALTGRKLILKIEGTYHGHHDSLMVSVFPPQSEAGPARSPRVGPADARPARGVRRPGRSRCRSTTRTPRSARSSSTPEQIAGMIVEPVMTNCGVVLPDPGYLAGAEGHLSPARRVARVRRGEDRASRVAWGGAIEAFGVRARPRLPREGARRRACRAARSAAPRRRWAW